MGGRARLKGLSHAAVPEPAAEVTLLPVPDPDGRNYKSEADRFRRFFDAIDWPTDTVLVTVANEMNHHPDVSVSWDTVTVLISTHSEGGLTEADFELARKVDSLADA